MKSSPPRTYTVYLGGELFSLKHLFGNAALAAAIHTQSRGRFRCVLPQNLPPAGRSARAIRDQDIRALIACDLALFNYDGPELDSGTVVEFMLAKFADLPSVLLRTDIRTSGDFPGEPWNLMSSFFPRTATVLAPSLFAYRAARTRRHRGRPVSDAAAAETVCRQVATRCLRAFARLLATPPALPRRLRAPAYDWLARLPGLAGDPAALRREFTRYRQRKIRQALL